MMILLKLPQGSYFTLDEVGRRIWELCDGTKRVVEIISAIGTEYDAPLETVEADVLELLGELQAEGLLTDGI